MLNCCLRLLSNCLQNTNENTKIWANQIKGDCHDPKGVEDMCVAGAIQNFTAQLGHFHHGTSDRRCKDIHTFSGESEHFA